MAKPQTVLFVRVSRDLQRALKQRLQAKRAANPGVQISMADMIRSMLWDALNAEVR